MLVTLAMEGNRLKKLMIIIISFFIMPPMIISAYQQRGYFAIGGEWLIVPLVALVVYGLAPTITELYKACFEEEQDE